METAEIAKIAVSAAPYSIDKPYDYLIPPEFAETAVPGVRVSVPFGKGNRSSEGIILSRVTGEKSPRLKAIGQVLDAEPMLSGADIKQIFGSEKAFNKFQANVYNELGENYYETSRTDIRAFKMFDRAAVLNPDFGKAFYKRAYSKT